MGSKDKRYLRLREFQARHTVHVTHLDEEPVHAEADTTEFSLLHFQGISVRGTVNDSFRTWIQRPSILADKYSMYVISSLSVSSYTHSSSKILVS